MGRYLEEQRVRAGLVLGLPRGGVVVAAQVARILRLPLDVIVVRKIGHPRHREYAIGALAEGDVVVLDRPAMEQSHVVQQEMEAVIAEEKKRLNAYQLKFAQPDGPPWDDKTVLIVDDGLATGATTEAAVAAAKGRKAHKVMVAVPVASDNAFERIQRVADEVFTLLVDPEFDAVGRYYLRFPQTTDQEVIELLERSRERTS